MLLLTNLQEPLLINQRLKLLQRKLPNELINLCIISHPILVELNCLIVLIH